MIRFNHDSILKKAIEISNIDQHDFGEAYMKELAKRLAISTQMPFAVVGMPRKDNPRRIETKVLWANNDFQKNFEYDLYGTPCEFVIDGERTVVVEDDVARKYPEDHLLEQMGIESYAGSPIITSEGELLGLVILMSNQEIENSNELTYLLEYSAHRLALELLREKAENNLKNINLKLEQKVNESVQKVKETQELLHAQEKFILLGKIIAGISHELKTP